MTLTKTHVAVGFAIFSLVGLTLLLIYLWQRRQSKTLEQIKIKVQVNTKPNNSGMVLTGQPAMYGTQPVYLASDGLWKIAPKYCQLVETGIVDWDKIKAMSEAEKNQLYYDIDKCDLSKLPLLQP